MTADFAAFRRGSTRDHKVCSVLPGLRFRKRLQVQLGIAGVGFGDQVTVALVVHDRPVGRSGSE
ncbi:MAG: hypothetical protein ACLPUG_00455, partial [Acidimicrobiales bacterium]